MAISSAEEINQPTTIIGWASENRTRRAMFSDKNILAIKADTRDSAFTETTLEEVSLDERFTELDLTRHTILDQQCSDTHSDHLGPFAMFVLDNIR